MEKFWRFGHSLPWVGVPHGFWKSVLVSLAWWAGRIAAQETCRTKCLAAVTSHRRPFGARRLASALASVHIHLIQHGPSR